MAMANYRFPRPRREEDLKSLAASRMIEKGMRPSSLRTSESESAKDVAGKWNAAVAKEAQAIKESRDPKLRRKEQLTQRESAKAKADASLRKSGLTPEDFWSEEPGMARTSFTERTGKKVQMPKGTEVAVQSREVDTPEGGKVRQIAGPAGYGSIKMDKKAADALAKRREKEEQKAFALAAMRERGTKLRMEREKREGAASIAKRESWEADKRAFAEGQQIQREARKRLTRVNRALRGAPDFDQYGRTAGYGQGASADEFNALLEEQSMLKNIVNRRETLRDKGITDIGRQAEATRQARIAEAENIRLANEARALASGYGISGIQNQTSVVNPYISSMDEFYKNIFQNISGGYGVPGLSYPQGSSGS